MRLVRHKTLVSAMAFMAIAPVGYARSQPTGTNHSSKLLTAKAGTQLVNVALRYQPEDGVKPDCSHLVYEIYRQAGLNFRFASSRELYVGVDPFQRVRRPQSGDLIVWRGHVGIVVNPREHSFYSSLRSGLMTDYYDAAYWSSRGTPRFYRYRVGAQETAASPRAVRTAHRSDNSTSNGEEQLEGAEPTGTANIPDRDSTIDARSRFLIPAAELSAKPTAEEFRGALLHHIDDAGAALESRQSLDASASVLVVNDVTVEKFRLKKDQGALEIRLDCSVTVINGQVSENPMSQERKLNLVRSNAGWLVEDREAPLYVPRQIALRVFATQLAMATRQDDHDEEVTRLIRVLNALAPEK
jgi:NlpC/P60 family protein